MKWRPALIVALVFLVAAIGAQVWLMERQRDLRAQQQARHQEAVARWAALPKGPGHISPPMPVYYEHPAPPPILLWQAPLMAVLAAAAVAQEEKIRKEREAEEESRTTYTEEDLMTDWEFKIVRSPVGLFGRPAFLERILAEEAAGGWRLVEKFDSHRVRLKRPAGSMPSSATFPPGYDPFRTVVGPRSRGDLILWSFSAFFWSIAILVVIVLLIHPDTASISAGVVGGLAVVGGLVLAWFGSQAGARFRELAG